MPWVEGSAILATAGKANPSTADEDWADLCAAAVDAAITTRLRGLVPAAASAAESELLRAAMQDGLGAYMDRDAPQGILTVGPDGSPVRVRPDILRACVPVLERYTLPGIG